MWRDSILRGCVTPSETSIGAHMTRMDDDLRRETWMSRSNKYVTSKVILTISDDMMGSHSVAGDSLPKLLLPSSVDRLYQEFPEVIHTDHGESLRLSLLILPASPTRYRFVADSSPYRVIAAHKPLSQHFDRYDECDQPCMTHSLLYSSGCFPPRWRTPLIDVRPAFFIHSFILFCPYPSLTDYPFSLDQLSIRFPLIQPTCVKSFTFKLASAATRSALRCKRQGSRCPPLDPSPSFLLVLGGDFGRAWYRPHGCLPRLF